MSGSSHLWLFHASMYDSGPSGSCASNCPNTALATRGEAKGTSRAVVCPPGTETRTCTILANTRHCHAEQKRGLRQNGLLAAMDLGEGGSQLRDSHGLRRVPL